MCACDRKSFVPFELRVVKPIHSSNKKATCWWEGSMKFVSDFWSPLSVRVVVVVVVIVVVIVEEIC